jgi:arabinogalactan oligomer/maltooligosaccharide transport system permease protein
MAKTKETPVTEAPRAMNLSVKDARKRQKMVDDGGTPTLRGTILKIILLGLADALALFVTMILITGKRIDYAAAVVIVTLIFNWIYLRRGGLPAKYLAPGVLFLICFSFSVVVYSGFISFTNYGGQHNGSKEDSIASVELGAVVNDIAAPWMDVTILKDDADKHYFLATDASTNGLDDLGQPIDPIYYFGGEEGTNVEWAEIADDAPTLQLGPGMTGYDIALGYGDYTALSVDDINAQSAKLAGVRVALPDDPQKGFMALDPTLAGVQRTFIDAVYDSATDSFTRQSDGVVFKANDSTGFFENEAGERLNDTGWQAFVGLKNFELIFGKEELRAPLLKIFSWTVVFAVASVVSTFVLGLALALLFNDERLRGKKIYRAIMILPYAFPGFLSAYVWKGMFNADYGFINYNILGFEPGTGIPWLADENWAKIAILLCNLWLGFPYMFLITTGALQAIPSELVESATIDGASAWQILRQIKLPLLLVSLSPLLISSFAFNFNNFTIIYLITGGGPSGDPALGVDAGGTDILISFVYKIAFSSSQGADYGLASAFSILIFFIVGGLSMIGFRRTKFLEEAAD